MDILFLGGTRFFGIHTVSELIKMGHNITIATRGKRQDHFGNNVKHITIERTNCENLRRLLGGKTSYR